jgi:NDP-sugar pyrophosphorylase family protein
VVDLGGLLAAHRASGAVATIVVGADAAGRLRPTGVYVFARSTIRFIPEGGFYDIKEKLIPRLYRAGEYVATHMASGMAPRAVSAESYLALNHWALERKPDQTRLREGFLEHGEAFVHETAIIDPSARLLGPALVGPCASIGVGATLVGPVSIGRRTTVGEGAVVSRSVVWSRCVVGKGAFVDRSMLADGARVGTRELVVAALRADGRRIPQASATMRRAGRALWAPLGAALRPPTTNER